MNRRAPHARLHRRGLTRSAGWLLGLLLAANGAALAATGVDGFVADARKYLAKGEAKAAVIQLKNALQADPSHVEARLLLATTYLGQSDGPAAEKEYDRARQLGAPSARWMPGFARAVLLQNDYRKLLERVSPDASLPAEERASLLALRGHAHLALNDREAAAAEYDQALGVQPGNAEARLGRLRILIADQRLGAARDELEQLIADHPSLAEAYVVRGELARQAKELDRAAADFARVVELDPSNLRGHLGVALVAAAQQRPDDALAAVKQIRQRFGDVPFAGYLHGLAAFQKRELAVAAEQLQRVLSATPNHLQSQLLYGVVSYAQGDFGLADEYISRVASATGQNPAVAKLLGATRLKLREPLRAIDAMQRVADRYPDDAQLLALLGNAYLQSGNNSRGSEYLARAVELDPEQALLRTQLALGQLAGGDTAGAISELEAAVELGQDLVQADVLLVLSYLNRGERDKALETAVRLEERMPDSPIPYNLSGLAYLASGAFEEAEAKFQKALAADPEFVVASMNLARLAVAAGRPEQASVHYQAVLDKVPNHLGALLGLAALAERRGDAVQLESWLARAQEANPQALQPVLLLSELQLRRSEPLKALTLLNGLPPERQAQSGVLRARGMAQLQAGDFNSALRTLEQLTAQRPDYLEGWFQLARAQAAAGNAAASRASFRRAIELDADNAVPLLWIGLGELELRDQRYEAALAHAKEMQRRFPENAMAFEIEAAAHRGLGNADEAVLAVEQAVRTEGTTKRVNLLAQALAGAGQTERATNVLRDWVKEHPDDGVSWTTLAILNQQLDRTQDAIGAYESALALVPDNPVVLNNLAWLYQAQQDPRALDLARRAYGIAPERPEIVDTYGWILFQSGRRQEGLSVLQQALVAAPRNPEIGLHVAEALLALDRAADARPLLQRIQREHPRTEWEVAATELLERLAGSR